MRSIKWAQMPHANALLWLPRVTCMLLCRSEGCPAAAAGVCWALVSALLVAAAVRCCRQRGCTASDLKSCP